MPKKYNTPKRSVVVKTRMTEEEYIGNTKIKVSEHFAKDGKPLEALLEDVIKYYAKSSL